MESLKNAKNMKTILNTFIFLLIAVLSFSQQNRGFKSVNIEIDGQITELYKQSHALVIGVSDYTNGWPDLPGVIQDVKKIQSTLEQHNFNVVLVKNPDERKLEQEINDFFDQYGMDIDNRLLFYFVGHGHTTKFPDGSEIAYIVPTDAPLPEYNSKKFIRKTLNLNIFKNYSHNIRAKHVLFLFNACLSASWFEIISPEPKEISFETIKSARQFIVSQNENIIDKSLFCSEFLKSINGDADINNDGYVTCTELGDFLLKSPFTKHTLYARISDNDLNKGDFIFISDKADAPPKNQQNETSNSKDAASNLFGTIKLTTEIDGQLYLDQKHLKNIYKNTIITINNLKEGYHLIEIKGENNWDKAINISKGQMFGITAEKPKQITVKEKSDVHPDSLNIEMIFVEGGCYMMGNDNMNFDEKPAHEVCIDDFYIGKYEVTQKQWKKIMGKNTSYNKCDNCPVECVNWLDVQEFIAKLNQKTGMNYRLPTEAEWEYAARGGSKRIKYYEYCGSNNIEGVAWFWKNSGERPLIKDLDWHILEHNKCRTHEVGTKQANVLGIFDMSGNVWEWCSDWYSSSYYSKSGRINPQGPISGANHVFKGGGWYSTPDHCRISNRSKWEPKIRDADLGFRLALDFVKPDRF